MRARSARLSGRLHQYGTGPATFVGGTTATTETPRSFAPAGTACGNAALSTALDFDDTVLGGHTGHSAVIVALACARATDALADHSVIPNWLGGANPTHIGQALAARTADEIHRRYL